MLSAVSYRALSSTVELMLFAVPLTNARQVSTLLERARSRRAVAATLMNERSSRSHSVFTLKVKGYNPLTEEKCEAMLNLGQLSEPVLQE